MSAVASPAGGIAETVERFSCFGSTCAVLAEGDGPLGSSARAVGFARRCLHVWHAQFSRFEPDSELSRLNRDERACVPVTPTMLRFVQAAIEAATRTGGLVDPTLLGELEQAGYGGDLRSPPVPLSTAIGLAPPRRVGAPAAARRWRGIGVDSRQRLVTRPPGVQLDSGGLVKGLAGDLLASWMSVHASFAVDAAGDLRFGGTAARLRPIQVASPFDGSLLHTFELTSGAVATSGIGRRSWIGADGRPAHHLLDPATGAPAFTGIVQVTALAPMGVEAEVLSKAALLSGPDGALGWLPHGGLIVHDDGSAEVAEPSGPALGS